jgi:3-dehydroquinate dehydratase I
LQPQPLVLRGRPLADARLPAVCAPLVARTREALAVEAASVAALQPDLLEWRVDFLAAIDRPSEVLAAARALRGAAGGIPILFTRRSQREGGQAIALTEPQVLALYEEIAASGTVDAMDFEMGNDTGHVAQVRALTRAHGLALVLSFHDFQRTPIDAELDARFNRAQELEADVAKVAVMPQSMADVHRLLCATLRASERLSIPVISMAMGGLGAVTRLAGGVYGSALTFAVGSAPSAPGQIPIAEVRSTLAVLQRATSG